MPCNIGYKSYAKIEIPAPQPQVFAAKAKAPDIDEELLEKLGEEDSQFLEWAKELDAKPLLSEALKRALAKGGAGGIDFKVDAKGMLEAKGSFVSAREKQLLTEKASAVSDQWQFEILGIVAELLNYRVTISGSGKNLVLEAEEEGKMHPCNYIKVARNGNSPTLVFEHFKSRDALKLETAKFLTLAHRLGVKIVQFGSKVSEGDPFPSEVRVAHKHPQGQGH